MINLSNIISSNFYGVVLFLKKIKVIFVLTILTSALLLSYSFYSQYSFKNKPLKRNILEQINLKHKKLANLAFRKYGIKEVFQVVIKKELPSRLFGMATYSKDAKIVIYLNRSRFNESLDYMLDSVFPHEYAHAVMFYFKKTNESNKGHSKQWQKVCQALDGDICDRFAKHNDIVVSKLKF